VSTEVKQRGLLRWWSRPLWRYNASI